VLGEEFRNAHVTLVRRDREGRVSQSPDLLAYGGDDSVIGMPDRRDADAGAEIEELVAVDIHQDRAVRARDVRGKSRIDSYRNRSETALMKCQ
jgi:hypothetical protein